VKAKVVRSTPVVLANLLTTADMVVGAVLIPGAAAPKLVTRDMLPTMLDGSVLVNMPGAVSRTSTYALNATTLVHAKRIAKLGWKGALKADPNLLNGLNVCEGKLTYAAVGEALGLDYVDASTCV